MTHHRRIVVAVAFVAVCVMAIIVAPAQAAGPHKKILFFTRSAGYEHSVIKVKDDKPCYAETILRPICEKNGWDLTVTKDGSVFTPENIAAYDAFAFYTTGDLTAANSAEHTPPMSKEGKAAFLQAIHDGKGFIGFHSASDSFHTHSDRYQTDSVEERDPYIVMLGGEFIQHGAQQGPAVTIADNKFPGFEKLGHSYKMTEEWYSLKDFADNLHVLTVIQTGTMKGNMYERPPYPNTWAHMYGKGRVFYTAMGHREDVWTSPVFQSVITGGIRWITREVDADVTPNLTAAAPGANQMPPKAQPKKK
jgi:uncharacterized protein